MGFEFLVASGDSLVQIAAANGGTRVVIYALRYFWRAGGYAPATRGSIFWYKAAAWRESLE